METLPFCSSLQPESIEHKQTKTESAAIPSSTNCTFSLRVNMCLFHPSFRYKPENFGKESNSLIYKAQEAKQTHSCSGCSDLNSRLQTLQQLYYTAKTVFVSTVLHTCAPQFAFDWWNNQSSLGMGALLHRYESCIPCTNKINYKVH